MPPEFTDGLVASLGDAILRTLRADAGLSAYFAEIIDAEVEDTWLGGGYQTPALLVALDELEETPLLSGAANLLTVWQLTLVHPLRTAKGTNGWLQARIVERIKKLLYGEEHGMLVDEDENPITEASITFQRIGPPIYGPDKTIRTRLRVAWPSEIDAKDRGFLD